MDLDFADNVSRLRTVLFEMYNKLYTKLMTDPEKYAPAILEVLLDQRNIGVPLKVPASYFKFPFLPEVGAAEGVILGAVDEIDWLTRAEVPGDIEARFAWINDQEEATLGREPSLLIDKKLSILKGRWLVCWTALVKLGIFRQDAEG